MFATLIAVHGDVHGEQCATTYLEWTDSSQSSRRCRSDPRAAELVLHSCFPTFLAASHGAP